MQILQDEDPTLIFIAEPWLHLPDAPLAMNEYLHMYNYYLNSEDRHDTLLSLSKSRAHGGTLAIWKKELDAYVTVLEPPSSHILTLLLEKPGFQTTIHISVYLPTAGKDAEFMKELSILQDTSDLVSDKYSDSLVFLRGDANASIPARSGNKLDILFKYFLEENKFSSASINHKTYHHFTNNGLSDSSIDVILFSDVTSDGTPSTVTESVSKLLCIKTNANVDSSHDVILSTFLLPVKPQVDDSSGNIREPKIEHSKHMILWSEEGIIQYQKLLSQCLPNLKEDYCDVDDRETASVLRQVTNHMLTEAAMQTNKKVMLGEAPKAKKPFIPSEIKAAVKFKENELKHLNYVENDASANTVERETAAISFKQAKATHQNLVRKHNVSQEVRRDNEQKPFHVGRKSYDISHII